MIRGETVGHESIDWSEDWDPKPVGCATGLLLSVLAVGAGVLVLAALLVALLLGILGFPFWPSNGSMTIVNRTGVDLYVREYSFGDGPETTSRRVHVPPHSEVSVGCGGLFRDNDLVDVDDQPLDLAVACPTDDGRPIVVRDRDLPELEG